MQAHTQMHTLTIKTMFYNLFLLLLFVSVCVFTFSPDTTHRDSVSMHLEFLKHLSSCLLSFTDNSDCLERQRRELTGDLQSLHTVWVGADAVTFECVAQFGRGNQGGKKKTSRSDATFISYLPCSNAGEARGDSSMLKNMIPSLGRLSFGATSSHDTWAITL